MKTPDYKDVWNLLRNTARQVTESRNLTQKSSGTKTPVPSHPVDEKTGYWSNPSEVSSKPSRWIVHFRTDGGAVEAGSATSGTGEDLPGSRTVGYINNGDGKCAVTVFRIMAAVHKSDSSFRIANWDWLILFAFEPKLPTGSSGQTLYDFDPAKPSIRYGTGAGGQEYPIKLVGLITVPACDEMVDTGAGSISYTQATDALLEYLSADGGVQPARRYEGGSSDEMERLDADLTEVLAGTTAEAHLDVDSRPDLVGVPDDVYLQIKAAIECGKKHIILYGPPGTGKTTMAQWLADELSEATGYEMLTASSSWTSQELIGGYQPLGGGKIGFVPGAILRSFDRPIVIDELNRCPVDKVIGPLFSVLSGQATTLPYKEDVGSDASPFHVILSESKSPTAKHEHCPGSDWRIIATLNTCDKSQLGQISYALSRRFAWIRVGVPEDLEKFVVDMLARKHGIPVPPAQTYNPIAKMWGAVNEVREIGGAPIIDAIDALMVMCPEEDLLAAPTKAMQAALMSALCMFILPMLDGISSVGANELVERIGAAWLLDDAGSSRLKRLVEDFIA